MINHLKGKDKTRNSRGVSYNNDNQIPSSEIETSGDESNISSETSQIPSSTSSSDISKGGKPNKEEIKTPENTAGLSSKGAKNKKEPIKNDKNQDLSIPMGNVKLIEPRKKKPRPSIFGNFKKKKLKNENEKRLNEAEEERTRNQILNNQDYVLNKDDYISHKDDNSDHHDDNNAMSIKNNPKHKRGKEGKEDKHVVTLEEQEAKGEVILKGKRFRLWNIFKRKKKLKDDEDVKLYLEKTTETQLTWEELNVAKLNEEIGKCFICPSYCKLIAWVLGIIWIMACYYIVLSTSWDYGSEFFSYFWSLIVISIGFLYLIFEPLLTIILSIFMRHKLQFTKLLAYQQIHPSIFMNPPNEEVRTKVEELRAKNADCYGLVTRQALYWRRLDLRDRADIINIFTDVLFCIVFSIVIMSIMYGNRSNQEYFGTTALASLLVHAEYTDSIQLNRVLTYHQFIEYLNETLIPALLLEEDTLPYIGKLANTKVVTEPQPDGYFKTRMMDRGWTKEPALKLIGIPRLRQQRVIPSSCDLHLGLQRIGDTCYNELGTGLADTESYAVAWRKMNASEVKLNYSSLNPWKYNGEFASRDMRLYGRLNNLNPYSGGGYVMELGKSVRNARSMLNYMYFFNWIDLRTRMIAVDFTIFSPGANLFNVVNIMFEVSATGVFIPSFKIHTDKLLFGSSKFYTFFAEIVLYSLLFLHLVLRQFSIMFTIGVGAYFREFWTVMDFILAGFGFVSIITTLAEFLNLSFLLEELNRAGNNNYVSFQKAVMWHKIQTYADAVVVTVLTVKVFRLLTFTVGFYKWERILRDAWWPILGLFLIAMSSVLAFALYFKGILQTNEEEFTTIWGSMFTMLAHSTRRHDVYGNDDFLTHAPYVGPLFFAVFLLFSSYMILTTFGTILSVHLRAIRNQPLRTHFHTWGYIKTIMKNKEGTKRKEKLLLRDAITIHPRRFNIITPYLDEVRLQGLKRIALHQLNGRDYTEESAINIIYMVIGGNARRQATDKYNISYTEKDKIIIGDTRICEMMEVAKESIKERNDYLIRISEND